MKAFSFLNMVTLLTASARGNKEFDVQLARLILLYSKPPGDLCATFANLHPMKGCDSAYFSCDSHVIILSRGHMAVVVNAKPVVYKRPGNLNELITAVHSREEGFVLEFTPAVVSKIGFNDTFKELANTYGG